MVGGGHRRHRPRARDRRPDRLLHREQAGTDRGPLTPVVGVGPDFGRRNAELTLADRVFTCGCGYRLDRDLNAAINLACWAAAQHETPDPQAGGRVINAR
ncbi:transposase [Nocardia sp. 852002-20019_SCH5090214]|uniref:transposase n=1 Tax=Nocardia sp. 852002-20019_SCH5090214 TaxID=1834087 RepID=UPI0021010EBB|nr:transposase [Nocardia sp. 852002-20019_SCH5090214]